MKRHFIFSIILFYCFFGTSVSNAQNKKHSGIDLIENYLFEEKIQKADSVLQSKLKYFKNLNQIDSTAQYSYYIGRISLKKNGSKKAITDTEQFLKYFETATLNNEALYTAYKDASYLFDELGENLKAYNACKTALNYVLKVKNVKKENIGLVRYLMAYSAYALNNYSESKKLFLQAVKDYEASSTTKKDALADAYNTCGAVLWHFNKLDSAQYYYEKAIKTINNSDSEAITKLYLSNVYRGNIALLEESKGNISESIKIHKKIISDLEFVVKNTKEEHIKERAQRIQSGAIGNLGATYNDLGNLSKAYEIQKLALKKKKLLYEPSDIKISNTLINIGIAEFQLQEFDKSINTFKTVINQIDVSSGNYFDTKASAFQMIAKNYFSKKLIDSSKTNYEKSAQLFSEINKNNYTQDYLVFLKDYSLFLAELGDYTKALKTAKKAFNYVEKSGGEQSTLPLKHALNIAHIYYESGNYLESEYWANKGNNYLTKNLKTSVSRLDSIKIEFNKPELLLLESKSKYQSTKNKDYTFLKSLDANLESAIKVLEKRKTTIYNANDINSLIEEFNKITDFLKLVNFELFNLTNNSKYLDKVISLNESGVYNKIRSRLNLKNTSLTGNLPKSIILREKELKKNLSNSLDNSEASIKLFFEAENSWTQFLDSLKQLHPKYYKMRYATISESLENVQQSLPKNISVVRYFFIDKKLYALSINNSSKEIFNLNSNDISETIAQLTESQYDIKKTSSLLYSLYQKLWRPFEKKITTKNVIIIPDGALYNLSFETLTPTKIKSFKELLTNSLLAKHNISYNYSMYLLEASKNTNKYKNSFIAFAPEFNDKMKESYKLAITDSINLDKTYLTLLQQPFNVDLAKIYANTFDGNYFINENSTEQIFKQNANEHKIIHIGTHAESNNISPELSRLIFAKNVSDQNDDGSLYTYEIYNTSLNANLAILTACETGKPSYQAGEGMISLAHAFNYAGSESILTSLWKVDERATSEIIDVFYKNIKDGKPKDEALRLAKINYINNTEGRTVSPKFWAGLVLMGDASPINISSGTPIWQWMVIIGCIFLGIILLFKFRKN